MSTQLDFMLYLQVLIRTEKMTSTRLNNVACTKRHDFDTILSKTFNALDGHHSGLTNAEKTST